MAIVRTNYYIQWVHPSIIDRVSRALARILCDPRGTMPEKELYYTVAEAPAPLLEGYAKQAVLLWEDYTASTLIERVGGANAFCTLFDPSPSAMVCATAQGTISLNVRINIVTGDQTWKEFVNEMREKLQVRGDMLQNAESFPAKRGEIPPFLHLYDDELMFFDTKSL